MTNDEFKGARALAGGKQAGEEPGDGGNVLPEHELVGGGLVTGDQALLKRPSDAVHEQGGEEQDETERGGGRCVRGLLGVPREHGNSDGNEGDTDVLAQRISVATNDDSHEHDGNHLAGLAQGLHRVGHVVEGGE